MDWRENRKGGKMDQPNLVEIANRALEDFWDRVAKQIPKITSGDLSPEATLQLQLAAERAVVEWWNNNCPE